MSRCHGTETDVKEAMEYKLERLNTTLINPLDLQYTDLQQVDVLPGNPGK